MFVIHPYFDHGDWVFDDEAAGLKREPFVFGMPEMINNFVSGIPGARDGFKLYFSAKPFPGYTAELEWVREEYEGNWYRWPELNAEGWLCPALFKYFPSAPPRIYCRAEANPQS
ncbi:DUF6717 family protein [Aestuariivirga sp.]|uniref:DUF6717 family protein n=1 Tax=Aestuariivirga sp. TaxID=2650926 RepID=UPI0039E62800